MVRDVIVRAGEVEMVRPGLGQASASESYEAVNAFGRMVLTACMLLGRLEILQYWLSSPRHAGEGKRTNERRFARATLELYSPSRHGEGLNT